MDVIANLISRLYVEYQARFRCLDPARVDAGARVATTGLLEAAVVRYQGFDYHARVSPADDFFALVTLTGTGTLTAAREQVRFTRGDVLLDPTDRPYTADMHDCSFALLRVPRPVTDDLAEEHTGLPLRTCGSSRSRRSPPRPACCGRTLWRSSAPAAWLGDHRDQPDHGARDDPAGCRRAAGSLPNTTMTAAYIPGPGRVPSATVRRAAAFIDDHAGQPVTMPEIAAAEA